MAEYLIVYETVTDRSKFSRYVKSVDPVISRRGGRLVASGPPDVAEGEFPFEHALVFEQPTRQAASDFWHSEEYTEIEKLREGAAVIQAIIIEGIHLGQGKLQTHNTFSARGTMPRLYNGPEDLMKTVIFLNLTKHNERALQYWEMS